MFPKDYGLNDTDIESGSDEETWFDSISSDSDPESEFYSNDTGETTFNYYIYEYFISSISQGFEKKIGFLCPDDWGNELKLNSLDIESFLIKAIEQWSPDKQAYLNTFNVAESDTDEEEEDLKDVVKKNKKKKRKRKKKKNKS